MQCQKLKTYMETGRVVFLPARSIRPNPAQPRKIFRPEALDELSDSIRQHGILQPLSVRRSGNGYELIAGERRLRAAELAGITDIPCIIMSMDDRESGMAAMVENLQRQDLDFIEEAMGISRLLEDWNMSQEQAARLLGKSQSAVANKQRAGAACPAGGGTDGAPCPGASEAAYGGKQARGGEGDHPAGHERGADGKVCGNAPVCPGGQAVKSQRGRVSQQPDPVPAKNPAVRHSRRIGTPGDGQPDRADHYNSKINTGRTESGTRIYLLSSVGFCLAAFFAALRAFRFLMRTTTPTVTPPRMTR